MVFLLSVWLLRKQRKKEGGHVWKFSEVWIFFLSLWAGNLVSSYLNFCFSYIFLGTKRRVFRPLYTHSYVYFVQGRETWALAASFAYRKDWIWIWIWICCDEQKWVHSFWKFNPRNWNSYVSQWLRDDPFQSLPFYFPFLLYWCALLVIFTVVIVTISLHPVWSLKNWGKQKIQNYEGLLLLLLDLVIFVNFLINKFIKKIILI